MCTSSWLCPVFSSRAEAGASSLRYNFHDALNDLVKMFGGNETEGSASVFFSFFININETLE